MTLQIGIRSFKVLLESILYPEDKISTTNQQIILTEYLNRERPRDDQSLPLEQLFQAWRFSAQVNHDGLSSAIPAILALLLKTLSHMLELRESGIAIAKAVFQEEPLRLISRGLGAPKEKEHLISPCLRLLSEAAIFDGGALTSRIHAARSVTLDPKLLTRCLTLGIPADECVEIRKDRPTVRANCIRYLLSLLRFSSASAKRDVLRSSSVARALFGHLRLDSTALLADTFNTINEYILKDEKVDRHAKSALLNNDNLSSIATLYRFDFSKTSDGPQDPIEVAHGFLTQVCTTGKFGLLQPSSGLYPPGTDRNDPDEEQDTQIDLGLVSVTWYRNFDKHIPVRNVHLSRFLRTLKPYSSRLECELAVSIFEAAPELIADFFRSTRFSLDPKLTATWIGFVAFLFSAIQIPLPRYFGLRDGYGHVPPPVSIVVDNILPTPMNQKDLTRCLNQSSDLITFSTVRLLTVAFRKLQSVLESFNEASQTHCSLWEESRQRLLDVFHERCPSLRDVIAIFHRNAGNDNSLRREAILRLLRLYHEVTPDATGDTRFDVSLPLDRALSGTLSLSGPSQDGPTAPPKNSDATGPPVESSGTGEASQDSASSKFGSFELDHLFSIAACTPDTRWFHKPQDLPYAPFTCLLSIGASGNTSEETFKLLKTISDDNEILSASELNALIVSLSPDSKDAPHVEVLSWLDDVVQRYVRKPIKYQDDGDAFSASAGSYPALWMTLLEQWPFALERNEASNDIALFLRRFLSVSGLSGMKQGSLSQLQSAFTELTKPGTSERTALEQPTSQESLSLQAKLSQLKPQDATAPSELQDQQPIPKPLLIEASVFNAPPDSSESKAVIGALHRVMRANLSELNETVLTGEMSAVLLCLSSGDRDVRSLALTSVQGLLKKLSDPNVDAHFPQGRQLWLLLGILENTVRASTDAQPVSFVVTSFASMAAPILTDPTNPHYEQINKFLLRGPVLEQKRILRQWLHITLREAPPELRQPPKPRNAVTPDTAYDDLALSSTVSLAPMPLTKLPQFHPCPNDPYHTGIHFFLSYLYHAIRTPDDLDKLRSSDVLEAILSIAGSDVFLARGLRELVIALLWRITGIEGGSDVLITRAGIVSWLAELASVRGAGKGPTDLVGRKGLQQLMQRLWQTCDQATINKWDSGGLDSMREAMGEEQWANVDQKKAKGSHFGVELMVRTAVSGEKDDHEPAEAEVDGDL